MITDPTLLLRDAIESARKALTAYETELNRCHALVLQVQALENQERELKATVAGMAKDVAASRELIASATVLSRTIRGLPPIARVSP